MIGCRPALHAQLAGTAMLRPCLVQGLADVCRAPAPPTCQGRSERHQCANGLLISTLGDWASSAAQAWTRWAPRMLQRAHGRVPRAPYQAAWCAARGPTDTTHALVPAASAGATAGACDPPGTRLAGQGPRNPCGAAGACAARAPADTQLRTLAQACRPAERRGGGRGRARRRLHRARRRAARRPRGAALGRRRAAGRRAVLLRGRAHAPEPRHAVALGRAGLPGAACGGLRAQGARVCFDLGACFGTGGRARKYTVSEVAV